MQRIRTHIVLPADLLAQVDLLVGERGRSAFVSDLVRREVESRSLLAALREAKGCWKTENHPELGAGSDAFVDNLRAENESRLASIAHA